MTSKGRAAHGRDRLCFAVGPWMAGNFTRYRGEWGNGMWRLTVLLVLLLGSAVHAESIFSPGGYVFSPAYSITRDGGDNYPISVGMSQIRLEVNQRVSGYVDFTFVNQAPLGSLFVRSSITDIWFDTASSGLLGPVDNDGTPGQTPYQLNPELIESAGVDFTRGATPANPPGGASVQPAFNVTFSTDTEGRLVDTGIQENEYLRIRWELAPGHQWTEIPSAISSGRLRIAVKMQGITNRDYSETFLFAPTPVAASGGLALFGVLLGLKFVRPRL